MIGLQCKFSCPHKVTVEEIVQNIYFIFKANGKKGKVKASLGFKWPDLILVSLA